jgi:hypothetical protein
MNIEQYVFWVSLAGLLVLTIVDYKRNKNIRRLILCAAVLLISGGVFVAVFGLTPVIQQKGVEADKVAFIVLLYVCMVLGMAGHYLFHLFLTPKIARPTFDFGRFIAPVFASPIVFIPLLSAFQNADIDLSNLTEPRYMVFFIAFENGFFWKEFFDNRVRGQK